MQQAKRIVYVLKNGDLAPRYHVGVTSRLQDGSQITTPAGARTPPAIVRGRYT
jgi:hypothetical protein